MAVAQTPMQSVACHCAQLPCPLRPAGRSVPQPGNGSGHGMPQEGTWQGVKAPAVPSQTSCGRAGSGSSRRSGSHAALTTGTGCPGPCSKKKQTVSWQQSGLIQEEFRLPLLKNICPENAAGDNPGEEWGMFPGSPSAASMQPAHSQPALQQPPAAELRAPRLHAQRHCETSFQQTRHCQPQRDTHQALTLPPPPLHPRIPTTKVSLLDRIWEGV